MYIVLVIMLLAACLTLFFSGYFLATISHKMGKSVLIAVPITVGLFMFNIIWALLELAKTPHWQ
jgi:hypothetical protein